MLVRLLDAVRQLDAASSLSAILESLAQCTLAEASRVVILVVNGETLQSWGHFGFAPGARSLRRSRPRYRSPGLRAVDAAVGDLPAPPTPTTTRVLPPFMRPPPGHVGLVAPLVVGEQVVAVLYADGAEQGAGPDKDAGHAAWADEVELMARHARARLENVTSERTVTALTRTA